MTYPRGWDTLRTDVRGEVFNEHGKWKYSVSLDYRETEGITTASGYADPCCAARRALAVALHNGTSGMETPRKLPPGWTLVVFDPPNGWPVLVRG